MTAQERSEEAVELTDASLDQDEMAEEAAPAGAASEQADAVPSTDGEALPPVDDAQAMAADDAAGEQAELGLEELTAKAQRADEYLALAQRTQADFENYRKRAAREAAAAQERGVARLVKELLPAIDNLDRALKAAAADDDSQLAVGIRLVHTDLLAALARVGVEPFSPDGEQFDPQLHEAVAQQPVDGLESGLVAEVFQQGFRLGDSVLRPARVLVAA